MNKRMKMQLGLVLVVSVLIIGTVGIVLLMRAGMPSSPAYTMTIEITQNNFGQDGEEAVGFTVTATQYVTEVDRTFTRLVDRSVPPAGATGTTTLSLGTFFDSGDVINVQVQFESYIGVLQFTYDWSQDVYETTWQDITFRFGIANKM